MSDPRKIYEGCHYCLNMRTLDQLESIALIYVPKKFFSRQNVVYKYCRA